MSDLRCFVALELAPHIVGALLEAGAALRAAAPSWRDEKWVAEQNLHVTLKFLGNIPEARIDAIGRALGAALAEQPSFTLRLTSVRAVPSDKRSAMVWASFDDAEDATCEALAVRVDEAAEQLGVPADHRQFKPHVTLVRARRPHRLPHDALTSANAVLGRSDPSMSVLSATLFASTLTPKGPVYRQLAVWEFSTAGQHAN